MAKSYLLSSSPHVFENIDVRRLMLNVILALLPAAAYGVYLFGVPAAVLILTSVASCVILEENDSAAAGKSGFVFAGGHLYNDNSSLTSAGTDGEMVRGVVSRTLLKAGTDPGEIIAVKAHGTGTRDNDLSEGRGLAKVFGEGLPPVVSLKGVIGHTLGAAGTVETALWLSCLEEGVIPKSFCFAETDPEIGFAPSQENLPAADGSYLFTFFGFGGTCTGYVVTKR